MTRQKKSRKIGSIGTRKQESRPTDTKQPRRAKKPKGQPSGNRNSLVEESAVNTPQAQNKKTNPKIGSKKPISLVPSEKPKVEKVKPIEHSKAQPAAKVNKSKVDVLTPEQELANLESDERLIALAERVQDGELLMGKDAKYFNKNMDRLDELLAILGLDTEEDEQESEIDSIEKLGANEWDDLLEDEK